MKNNKNSGFTLIELVVIIVILAVLAVVALPRYLNYQRDAHLARADAAFASLDNAIQLYHSKWLTQGETKDVVDYGTGDIYPSSTGYPLTKDRSTNQGSDQIHGSDCLDVWQSLLNTDLTITPHKDSDPVYGNKNDIVSWYTGNQCYYYYTKGFEAKEELPALYYNPVTGETTRSVAKPSK